MDNNLADFDFSAAEAKIKELQTYKTALSFEISKNNAQAEELRNRLKFLEEKIEEHKALKASVLKEVEAKIEESEGYNTKLRALRIEYEHVKNDIESLKRSLEEERNAFKYEQASTKERQELTEETLVKRQKEVEKSEQEVGYKLKEVDARLQSIAEREEIVRNHEKLAQDMISSSELAKREADILKSEAHKMFDEGKSIKSIADEKMKDVNAHLEELRTRERNLKTDNLVLEEQKKQLKFDKRDIEVNINKLSDIKRRLIQEIENASIESKVKEDLKDEANG